MYWIGLLHFWGGGGERNSLYIVDNIHMKKHWSGKRLACSIQPETPRYISFLISYFAAITNI